MELSKVTDGGLFLGELSLRNGGIMNVANEHGVAVRRGDLPPQLSAFFVSGSLGCLNVHFIVPLVKYVG